MTLEEAVAILNRNRHHGHAGWCLSGTSFVHGIDQYEYFYPFEAIAIAEKYEREKLEGGKA